jgi:uncharacterized protein YbjT (DUF2867 family)
MTGTVLVTGARGKTGREVVSRLRERGVDVRAGSSRPGASVAFDWHDRATWGPAVRGVDAVYLVRPDLAAAPELAAGLVAENPRAHVVLLSEQGAEELGRQHWAGRVEEAVASRADSWTLLRPSWFDQVLTDARYYRDSIRTDRVLSLPSGGMPIAWVDTRDIAAVVVAALLDPAGHHGRAYTLTGPEALSVAAVADELSARLGYPVRAEDPPPRDAIQGMDDWTADLFLEVFDRIHAGGFAQVSPDAEKVTGRPPIAMAQFIDDHLSEWR